MTMENLSEIYDATFFEEWGPSNAPYVRTARRIARTLMEQLNFKSVVDLGCGCGVYSEFFGSQGLRVLSIDGVEPPAAHRFDVPVVRRDLTVPFENEWGAFDLALCLEVAEHIPEAWISPFLENLFRFAPVLALSCAPPGQGGTHHVNEQPKRYWVRRLAERGWRYDRDATGRLVETFKNPNLEHNWMGHHISIYRRDSELAAGRRGPVLPFS